MSAFDAEYEPSRWDMIRDEVALYERTDGTGAYAVIGSQGGAPTNPSWVHNLRAHPVARIQDGAQRVDVTAREVDGDEKATWWARDTAVWPKYDEYEAATDRPIPLSVLEPAP